MKNDKWIRFYTPEILADNLMDQIDNLFLPSNVIDICAGSCNLLRQAQLKWPKAKFYASDIEKINRESYLTGKFFANQIDARDISSIKKEFKRKRNKLVLANPPFGDSTTFQENSIPSNLQELYNSSKNANRIECQILISNFAILNTGDVFAGVLPENIFSADKMYGFRENIFKLFDNLKVSTHSIKFNSSEVKTRLFTGTFKQLKENRKISSPQLSTSKNNQEINLIRGIDNSVLKNYKPSDSNLEVLHFNNLEGKILQRKSIKGDKNYESKIIGKNDVLIFRVGRNAGKIFIPQQKHIGLAPSDLLLIFKNGKKLGKKDLEKFELSLSRRTKGLTSKYISKNDVYEALKPTENCA